MRVLSTRSQTDWGIPEDMTSPHDFKSAIFELSGLERNPNPSRRLNALVRTGKSVYAEFKEHVLPRLQAKDKGDTVLAADDLLPIFIFIICRSHLRHPLLNKDVLWGVCHPDLLRGECGYYLAMYESALQYILEQSVDVSTVALGDLTNYFDSDYSVLSDDESVPLSRPLSRRSLFSSRN